jgi:chemotaxis protein methyltransferase CheR
MREARHPDLQRFAAIVSRFGFHVHQHNQDQVEHVLRTRLRRTGCAGVDAYVARFEDAAFARAELLDIALELTVPESYFFRHPEHFDALTELALPERMRDRQATRRLNVLSAGCATGEEPYSLSAAMAGVPALHGWDVRIWGIDINPQSLQKARRARYTPWSLRALSDSQRRRHFRQDGSVYVLDTALLSPICFESRNLLDEDRDFWRPDWFDVVFCRNVLIYFSPTAVRALVERLTRSLAPGGFLFLGPSETLRGISQEFHLRHSHGTFYYQRRSPHDDRGLAMPSAPAGRQATVPLAPASREHGDPTWISTIAGASTRIAALADRSQRQSLGLGTPSVPPEPVGADAPGAHGLDEIRHLVRQERFDDALRAIGALSHDAGDDPDALLLQAVLLANRGELAGAEEICRRLLARDELRPGAYYLLAFCDERRGDYLAAAEHDQTAIYLDPAFAMPRLHLGLLAKRLGDLATAQRQLDEALVLLAREDASRILLFGGGFDRAALIRFCQAQLDRCGGLA